MLDTNILSWLGREPNGDVARQIIRVGQETIATSIVAAGELRFGAARVANEQFSRRIDRVLGLVPSLALDAPVDRVYADVRARLERIGKSIGNNDTLIAAHALALDLTLVTDNVGEFERVEGLRVTNWLRAA